jgi:hypothetical protein
LSSIGDNFFHNFTQISSQNIIFFIILPKTIIETTD